MPSLRHLTLTTMLLCGGTVAFAQVAQDSPGPADPPHVTTESREYCHHLADEIELRRNPPADVSLLVTEGKKMCSEGHLAGGLVRLRRAFLLTHPYADSK